jgi:transposase InsO family protein
MVCAARKASQDCVAGKKRLAGDTSRAATADEVKDLHREARDLKVIGWGWMYLSTILDDDSRYIIAWKLCTSMKAEDVSETLELALKASGCDLTTVPATSPVIWLMGWRTRA